MRLSSPLLQNASLAIRPMLSMLANQMTPVYTSKAAAGLIAYCRDGRFRKTDRVLFWHTGGVLTLL